MSEYAPGLAGVAAARSKIGFVDGQAGELFYRGYPISDLAEKSSFEEVAYLLMAGHLPTASELESFTAELTAARHLSTELISTLASLPKTGHPMDAIVCGLAALGMASPSSINKRDNEASVQSRWAAAISLLGAMPSIVCAFHRLRSGLDPIAPRADLNHASNFIYQMSGEVPDPLVAQIVDVALILHAEHGINASTFSMRVTGSTLTQPHAALCAAVSTLAGPLHGGANEDVLNLLEGLPEGIDTSAWVTEMLANKTKIPGFGHRVYKVKDPRAKVLQRLVGEIFERFGSTPVYDVATQVETAMAAAVGAKGIYPNVDFYSGIIYQKLNIPTDLFTPLFAVARTSGWMAHWLEQLEHNRIFRPTQIYEGELGLVYVEISQRSSQRSQRNES